MIRQIFFLIIALSMVPSASGQEAVVPKLAQYLTDQTGTLTASEKNSLEQKLVAFDDSTSTQIVVVMIGSIGGESIEDYSLQIAEANNIGRKGKDNGVLLLIAKNDRVMRIEVGYGLEGALPDAISDVIIRREITPWFKNGDYYSGIAAGVEAIMQATQNEYKADEKSDTDASYGIPFVILIIILFIVMSSSRSGKRGATRSGGFPIFGPPRGGFGGGSFGGFGGGGFSGGGGSFGGGGASGRW